MQRFPGQETAKFGLNVIAPTLPVFLLFYISHSEDDKGLKETTDLMLMSPAFLDTAVAHCSVTEFAFR